MAIMRNISKRRRAEEEKSRMEHQIRQIQKVEAIGTLAVGKTHRELDRIAGRRLV